MTPDFSRMLEELFEIDPTLRDHREQLLPLLEKLRHARPDAKPDAAFVAELRHRLVEKAALPAARSWSFSSLLHFSPVALAMVLIVLALPAAYRSMWKNGQPVSRSGEAAPLFAYGIQDAPARAFGSLANLQQSGAPEAMDKGGGATATPPMAPLPTSVVPAALARQIPTDRKTAAAEPMMLAPQAATSDGGNVASRVEPAQPQLDRYEYVFDGALPTLPDKTVSVLRRQKGAELTDLSAFQLGVLDLSTFEKAAVDSLMLTQGGDKSYVINLQLRDGGASISQNWETWPHPEMECRDDACLRKYRLRPEDVPSEAELVSIADAFLAAHKIDRSSYADPEADTTWKNPAPGAPEQAYVPDSISVVYPLRVDGNITYDQSGMKAGIRVDVSVRERRVSDVWGIQNQRYDRSQYAAVTAADVAGALRNADAMPADSLPKDANVRTVKVKLGEPVIGYVSYMRYDRGRGEELLVPSLLFPVKNASGGPPPWRKNVAVPLAKELLETASVPGVPMPRGK